MNNYFSFINKIVQYHHRIDRVRLHKCHITSLQPLSYKLNIAMYWSMWCIIKFSSVYMAGCVINAVELYHPKVGFISNFRIPSWRRHQTETFSALLIFCKGNPTVSGGFSSQRPVTWGFDVFFDLHRNKRLSKQSRRRWFETTIPSLWRHCDDHCNTSPCLGFIFVKISLIY